MPTFLKKWPVVMALFMIVASSHPGMASTNKKLTLGCLAYSEPMVQWIKEGLEPLGYDVKIMMFDTNQLPATALKDGNLDGIIANHRPWVMTFNRENNCQLDMVKPYYFHSFFAIYSTKYQTLDEIPENALIAVPGDPTNMSRSLIILKEAGLISLKEKTDIFFTILDIKDNPKNISLIETEITQTARSIHDVDAIISTAYFVGEATKDNSAPILFEDPQNKDYALGLIVRTEDLDADWAKLAMNSLRSDIYRKKFQDHFQGKYTLYP
ncbi:MAG: MetQ/NlpA family ABC transporter substrate-binding protein [Pseudomonadota bacterium]